MTVRLVDTGSNVQVPSCAACRGATWREVYFGPAHSQKRTIRLIKCHDCGLITQNPWRTTEQAQEHYAQLDNGDLMDSSTGTRLAAFHLELARLEGLTPGRRLLDVGCAAGNFIRVARDRGWDVFGVEPSEACAELARAKYGLNVRSGILRAEDWGDERFDVVSMSFVLEHIPNAGSVIREAIRLLSPRGVLYLTVPNCGSPEVRLRLRLGKFAGSREAEAGHVFFFSRRTLSELVEREGGRTLRVRDGVGGGLFVRRFPRSLQAAPRAALAALDLLDVTTSFARMGTTLRIWATRREHQE